MADQPTLVIILCGHCGVGKSSAANALLGRQQFLAQRAAGAVTSECCRASTIAANGREVVVIDTPGLTDPESSDVAVHTEIIRGFAAAAADFPNAHFMVLLVMSLASRVDETVIESFKELKRVCFGIGMLSQSCVLWTHGDLLEITATTNALPSAPLDLCERCGCKATSKFCPECGAPLARSQLPAAKLAASAKRDGATMEDALAHYLSSAGDVVRAFLDMIKGAPVVLENSAPIGHVGSSGAIGHVGSSGAEADGMGSTLVGRTADMASPLSQVVASAMSVAGPPSLLAPPKRRGKTARRERQQQLAVDGRIGRAREAEASEGANDGSLGAPEIPGLVGLLYRLWQGGTVSQRNPI